MDTLPLDQTEKARHVIYHLDAAEELAFKQLTHAKAVLVRAGLPVDDAALLGPVLNAIVMNMHAAVNKELSPRPLST